MAGAYDPQVVGTRKAHDKIISRWIFFGQVMGYHQTFFPINNTGLNRIRCQHTVLLAKCIQT